MTSWQDEAESERTGWKRHQPAPGAAEEARRGWGPRACARPPALGSTRVARGQAEEEEEEKGEAPGDGSRALPMLRGTLRPVGQAWLLVSLPSTLSQRGEECF